MREAERHKSIVSRLEREAHDREYEMEKICSDLLTAEQGLDDASRQVSTLKRERDISRSVQPRQIQSLFLFPFMC